MEITVLSEEENPMLHRTDVTFRVSHVEETPDRLGVRDSLAAQLNKSAEEVVVRKLDTKFGMRETIGEAKVYEAPEFADDIEHEYMLARNKIGDRAVETPEEPEEAPTEEPEDEVTEEPEEAPADEQAEQEDDASEDES